MSGTPRRTPLPVEQAVTDLWAQLTPVAGYTSGWTTELSELFIPTSQNISEAEARLDALRPRLPEIEDPDLRATAAAQLTLLGCQLAHPQPGGAVQDCADGAFYIALLDDAKFNRPPPGSWLPGFVASAAEKIAFETSRVTKLPLDIAHRKLCLTAADYCAATMDVVKQRFSVDITAVTEQLGHFRQAVDASVPGLDSDDFGVMFQALRSHTTAPVYTDGYPDMLRELYDFAPTASDLDLTARTALAEDMTIVRGLAAELGALLRLPAGSSVGDVWRAVSARWAIPVTTVGEFAKQAGKVCQAYAGAHLVEFDPNLKVWLELTPDYMKPVITGGQDIAVNYLTDDPASCLYLTAEKVTSLPTLLNIMVHEYSHGLNFVLAAKNAGSPLLNLGGPMQVPLTEGQAFWREWEFWDAAARLHGRSGLGAVERDYLRLYGATEAEQAQAIRAAEFETYLWRVVRHLRTLCDVQVNMGWRTFVDFLDWAAAHTGLSVEFLFGECFTFLAQPGYAPAYGVDGLEYGALQRAVVAGGGTAKAFNTKASGMGFYPWTVCVDRLAEG